MGKSGRKPRENSFARAGLAVCERIEFRFNPEALSGEIETNNADVSWITAKRRTALQNGTSY
jgi:hypothetical protein